MSWTQDNVFQILINKNQHNSSIAQITSKSVRNCVHVQYVLWLFFQQIFIHKTHYVAYMYTIVDCMSCDFEPSSSKVENTLEPERLAQ